MATMTNINPEDALLWLSSILNAMAVYDRAFDPRLAEAAAYIADQAWLEMHRRQMEEHRQRVEAQKGATS